MGSSRLPLQRDWLKTGLRNYRLRPRRLHSSMVLVKSLSLDEKNSGAAYEVLNEDIFEQVRLRYTNR